MKKNFELLNDILDFPDYKVAALLKKHSLFYY